MDWRYATGAEILMFWLSRCQVQPGHSRICFRRDAIAIPVKKSHSALVQVNSAVWPLGLGAELGPSTALQFLWD